MMKMMMTMMMMVNTGLCLCVKALGAWHSASFIQGFPWHTKMCILTLVGLQWPQNYPERGIMMSTKVLK